MPVGGKLKLKGGQTLGLKKKKKHKSKPLPEEAETEATEQQQQQQEEYQQQAVDLPAAPGGTRQPKLAQAYEVEFASEIERAKEGKAKTTPWGSGFSKAPEILHGYKTKVTGKTAEERLDMRCARKTDKFCK